MEAETVQDPLEVVARISPEDAFTVQAVPELTE
jgi:hypothetical protein